MKKLNDAVDNAIISGPENALLWTDYVLKNGGARHLRISAVSSNFIADYMLDVVSFLLVLVLIVLYLVLVLLRFVVRRLCSLFFRKRDTGIASKFKAL